MEQWFERESYWDPAGIPPHIDFGNRLDLVRVYPEGRTQPGWGIKEFMNNHNRGAFIPGRAMHFYKKYNQPFAIVMRSVPVICVDIDGKNGGIEMSEVLALPETLAERSKSGNGFHLFYEVPESVWHPVRGYDEFPDLIGLIPGVDIKATGVVYHYPHQRWNSWGLSRIPVSLSALITRASSVRYESRLTRTGVTGLNEEETVILWDQLRQDLEDTRFVEGGRNQRLYAIGAKMFSAGYPGWDNALYDRGLQIGLEIEELSTIIKNIEKYS